MTTSLSEVPSQLVTDFDVYDPALAGTTDKFQKVVAELRERGPVLYSNAYGGHWVVVGYEEAHFVLRNADTFSSYPNNLVNAADGKFLPLELDGDEHTAFRRALQPLFNPKRMDALRPVITDIVNRLIDGFADRGEAEFISEFAHELPTSVFLTLMGWPLDQAPMFTEMTDIALTGKPGLTDEENDKARAEAAQKIFGYFGAVIDDRRQNPVDDVTSAIVNTPIEIDGGTRLLTDDELVRTLFLLLIGGLHTVQGSLAWGIVHLSANPAERQKIIEDPDILPEAIEEILRLEGPTSMGRRATKDAQVGDVSIKAGDQILVVTPSANRDGREFDEPDSVQVDRLPNRHLTFGAGPHRCLGSHLARVELRIAFEEIHRRIPDYSVNRDRPTLTHASQVRGVIELPIRFTPETTRA
ncbi:cytochrome P450 [Rhodococcus sp. 14-2686-1-2]|nr:MULTISPECIES: cytochrome P450 [unclassified Rhodococcus (in: high G+C Gram-positive bacteria)]OZE93561.1 cytochrome P450 [Rhodococcus sp. 15-1189-1-1a]OZF08487.1 cytochrome P450 [Rhodococcus sp. 14-2686-1-2]